MYSVIHEIEFYPVDSAIQPSNNRAQVCIDNAKKKKLSVVGGHAFLTSFKEILRLSSFNKLSGK